MSSGYPPGHPTGTSASRATVTCFECDQTTEVVNEYERDVNANTLVEGEACESCGHEWTDAELLEADWETGDPYGY